MNTILYYGGFGLAIALFVTAAILFFIFHIPTVVKYLRRTNRKGLVELADVDAEQTQPVQHRKSQTFTGGSETTDTLGDQATDVLDPGGTAMPGKKASQAKKEETDATEILE